MVQQKFILVGLILLLTGCYQSQEADLIIHNAKIYSCDEDFNIYTAMAIKDGKIVQLGPEREILNGYVCEQVIDAQLKPIYPGFHDGHCHFLGYAESKNQVNLYGSTSFEEVVMRIDSFQKEKNLDYISGRGWDQTLWENNNFPTNDTLNQLFPDIPVLIRRVDGHAALANEKALEMANIQTNSTIAGGYIGVDEDGLTGLLLDNAYDSVAKCMPKLSMEEKTTLLKTAELDLFEVGLTSINDAGLGEEERDLFLKLYEDNQLKIRSYAMLFPEESNLNWAMENGIVEKNRLSIRSFKILADGALGSYGACLLEPYSDQPNKTGFLLNDSSTIHAICELAAELDYQVNTHCIGDSANRFMLKIYEQVIGSKADHRWKIEHAQVLHAEDFKYFQEIGVIPSVQPTHATSDMNWAEERLGSHRLKGAYAYKTLLDKNGRIVLGTDFPVEGINPLHTFYAAIARKDHSGNPKEGFLPEQALSRKEALLGMTLWPAYSNFESHMKGSLEAGKVADFVILTQDIMVIDEAEILNTFVEKTYLNGALVYDAY